MPVNREPPAFETFDDYTVYSGYGRKMLREDAFQFATSEKYNLMDQRLMYDKFHRRFNMGLQGINMGALLNTPFVLVVIPSFDPHMADVIDETVVFTVQNCVMSEPLRTECDPPMPSRQKIEKYSMAISHGAAMKCSTEVIRVIRDAIGSKVNDARTKDIIENFKSLFCHNLDAVINSICAGNIAYVGGFIKGITPGLHLVMALREASLSGTQVSNVNSVAMKNNVMIQAADRFLNGLFCANRDGTAVSLTNFSEESEAICNTTPMLKQTDIANYKCGTMGDQTSIIKALDAMIIGASEEDRERIALIRGSVESGVATEIKTIQDIMFVQFIGPKYYSALTKANALNTYNVITDTRRGIINIDEEGEIMITHTGTHIVNPHLGCDTEKGEIKPDRYISVIKGPIDPNGKFIATMSKNNGYTIQTFQGYNYKGRLVIICQDISKVTSDTKTPDKDICRDVVHFSRVGICGLTGALGAKESTLPNQLFWQNTSGDTVCVSLETAVHDYIYNVKLFNYNNFTDLYNAPQRLDPRYNAKATTDDTVIHSRGVWHVFPQDRRDKLMNAYADLDLTKMRWESPDRVVYYNRHRSLPVNQNELCRQRIVSDINGQNYHQPAYAEMLHDIVNQFMKLYFVLPENKKDNPTSVLETVADKASAVARFVPLGNLENLSHAIRDLDVVVEAGKNIFQKYLPSLQNCANSLEVLRKSLNNTEYGQDIGTKLLEYALVTNYKDTEAFYRDLASICFKQYAKAVVKMFADHQVIACDCNYELMKAMIMLPQNDNQHLGCLQTVCKDIIKVVDEMASFLKDLVDQEFMTRGGNQLSTQVKKDMLYQECCSSISNLTDITVPTPAIVGLIGSNMFRGTVFGENCVTAHGLMSFKKTVHPDKYLKYEGDSNKYNAYVPLLTPKKIFTTDSVLKQIKYNVFFALVNQLSGNTLIAAKPVLDRNQVLINSTDEATIDDKGAYSRYVGERSNIDLILNEKLKHVLPDTCGIVIVKAAPTPSLVMDNCKSFKTCTACTIDGILLKNCNEMTITTSQTTGLDAKLVNLLKSKTTWLPLMITPEVTNPAILDRGYIANTELIRKGKYQYMKSSQSRPEYTTYSPALHPVKPEAIKNRELIASRYSPMTMTQTIVVNRMYATPEGISALTKVSKTPTFGVMFALNDTAHTEHVYTLTTGSVHMRQGKMDFVQQTIDGTASTYVQENLKLNEAKPGITGTVAPHAYFSGFATDGNYNPRKYAFDTSSYSSASSGPSSTQKLYHNMAKARPGSNVGRGPSGANTSIYPFGKEMDRGIPQSDVLSSRTMAGCGRGNKSLVDIYLVPANLPINNFSKLVNIRNPGKNNVFQDNANEVTEAEFFIGAAQGITIPWHHQPYGSAYVINTPYKNIKPFLPSQIRLGNSAITQSLTYITNDSLEPLHDGMYSRKRQRDENEDRPSALLKTSPKIYVNQMSLSGNGCNNLDEVLASSMRLESATALSSLQQPNYALSNWESPVCYKDGNYFMPGTHPGLWTGVQRRK